MAKFITLYSGSAGNSTLISEGNTHVLVDMGQSCRRTINSLYELGLGASDVSAVLITHEHSDHISGLNTFLKHYNVPLYGTPRTLEYMKSHCFVPNHSVMHSLECDVDTVIGELKFSCFATSHDSVDCVGYKFCLKSGKSLAVATDLGFVSEDIFNKMSGCELVGLESNYDERKLLMGKYPQFLKSRIRSDFGHLSNLDSANCVAKLAKLGTKRVVLMHLSSENNEPEIALTGCLCAFENHGIDCEAVHVTVAPRHKIGEVIEI